MGEQGCRLLGDWPLGPPFTQDVLGRFGVTRWVSGALTGWESGSL